MMHALEKQFLAYPADFISHFFLLLPVAVAIYRRGFLTAPLLMVALYFSVRFIEECFFLSYALKTRNNHGITKVSLVLDCLLFGYVSFLIVRGKPLKFIGLTTLTAFAVTLANYLVEGSLGFSRAVMHVLMIVFPLIYFNQILAENRVKRIVHHSFFWISAGFLFYGMGTFMTAVFFDYLVDSSREAYNQFSNMDQWVSVVLSMLCAVGLWVSQYDRENYLQPI